MVECDLLLAKVSTSLHPSRHYQLAYTTDVPVLLAMMQATAAEQDVPDAVTATEVDLINSLGFGAESHLGRLHTGQALLVESPEGEVAGMALYFTTFVAWTGKPGICLEDLYVLPEYRCRGYARLLVQGVAKKAVELGCCRMEWLCYKQNDRALRFYRSISAKEMDSLTFLRLDGDAMAGFVNETLGQ